MFDNILINLFTNIFLKYENSMAAKIKNNILLKKLNLNIK